jgi:hypothetical protein
LRINESDWLVSLFKVSRKPSSSSPGAATQG